MTKVYGSGDEGAVNVVEVQGLFKVTVNVYPLSLVETESSSVEVTVTVSLVPCK